VRGQNGIELMASNGWAYSAMIYDLFSGYLDSFEPMMLPNPVTIVEKARTTAKNMAPPIKPGKSTVCPISCSATLMKRASNAEGIARDVPNNILFAGTRYAVTKAAIAGEIQSNIMAKTEYFSNARSQSHGTDETRIRNNPISQAFIMGVFKACCVRYVDLADIQVPLAEDLDLQANLASLQLECLCRKLSWTVPHSDNN